MGISHAALAELEDFRLFYQSRGWGGFGQGWSSFALPVVNGRRAIDLQVQFF